MNKWVMAKYMAPHLTIPEGHVLVNDEGNLVASKGFKTGAVDPGALPDLDIPLLVEQDGGSVDQLDEQLMLYPPCLHLQGLLRVLLRGGGSLENHR